MKTLEQIRKTVGNKFFSITFIKKNGDVRRLNGRLGVTKGVNGIGKKYNPSDFNYLTVYDVKNKGFRTVNVNTVHSLRYKGRELWN